MNETKQHVVVLGGAGFLGSHVADALTDAGHAVTVFDVRPSPYLREGQRMLIGDIMDPASVRAAVKGAAAVYHFAGIADLKEASERPRDTIASNTLGTVNVLEACAEEGVKRLVFASSVYVYSDRGSYYRISKLASELLIDEFQRQKGLDYTIVRYGSLYGPRSDLRNGIYRFVHEAVHDGKIVYRGTEHDRREYIHVHEAAKLSVRVLSEEFRNEHIILTGTQALTSQQVLTMICEMLGGEADYEIREPESVINYSVTPYRFSPKIGKKLVSETFTDVGEGILQLIEEAHAKKHVHDTNPAV